jgi:3-hydroxybutyryl-CoA dehydrogenase
MAKSTILVVGGGTMGRGIAGLCALSGFGTAIFEVDAAGRGRLRAAIEDSWERAARRGKVSAESVEAMRMIEEGIASAGDIDRAMELGYGHRMGPLKTSDLVGLDVRLSIAETLASRLSEERFRPPEILRRLVAKGHTGRKSGRGFYRWDGETAVETLAPESDEP